MGQSAEQPDVSSDMLYAALTGAQGQHASRSASRTSLGSGGDSRGSHATLLGLGGSRHGSRSSRATLRGAGGRKQKQE
eukprot:scaffold2141_cov282-Pinguiococcus_pyrenoidosus.AAC.23